LVDEAKLRDLQGESLFRALGDRQRQAILRALRQGELAAGDIAAWVDITPATVSHHLAILRGAGLVRLRKEGQRRIYAINLSVFEEAMMMLASFLNTRRQPL
jgi:DNA-binding transcriptional ArsR family regulator